MKKGFTFIELCVVISLLLVIVVAAIPSFNRLLSSHRLEKEVHQIALALTQAREKSTVSGELIQVSVDSEKNRIEITSENRILFSKTIASSFNLSSTRGIIWFKKETVPMRAEIRLEAKNRESKLIIVEPFNIHAMVR